MPEDILSQDVPSDEVRILPDCPTTTYVLFLKVTSFRETLSVPQELQVAEVEVQDVPLAEVSTVPVLLPNKPSIVKNLLFP